MSDHEPLRILDVHVPLSSLQYMNTPFTITLNRRPQYAYNYANNDHTIIIGRDGIAYENLTYGGKPSQHRQFQAFAGRPFDITLSDGTVIEARGDWWAGSVFPDECVTQCGYIYPESEYRVAFGVCVSTKALLDWMLRDRAGKDSTQ